MTDLISWLRQQLDIDQAEAYAAMPVPLQHSSAFNNDGTPTFGGDHQCGYPYARVLRQVQAHRAILAAHAVIPRRIRWYDEVGDLRDAELPVCVTCTRRDDEFLSPEERPIGGCATTVLLASIYSDRDGWQEEWSA